MDHNNQENATLLMFACKTSNINIVEMLLNVHGIRIFEKDKMNRNAVHYAFQNDSELQSKDIVSFLFQNYPQLKQMGKCQQGNYITKIIELQRVNLLKLITVEQVQIDFLKSEVLVLHQVIKMHKNHKKFEITLSLLKLLIGAGCRQQLVNDRQQNYIHYGLAEGIMSQNEISELLRQLKPEASKKQLTLQTSPQQKLGDQLQDQYFWESQSFSQGQTDFEVFSTDSDNYEPNHAQISEQMKKIAIQVQQAHQKTWAKLYPFYLKIYSIVSELYGTVEVIGSFASKLWIPNCDIDFLLIIPQQNSNLFDEIVENVFYRVKKLNLHYHIKLSLNYKLPMIKLILSKQFGGLQVQLFLSSKKNIATQYVGFIHQILAYYPQIQIIYSIIRKLLQVKSLHDHKNGGLKAYGLFLLIYSMRTQYHYPHVSKFLQHFAYYYGFAYQYVVELCEEQALYKINIIDPLNSQNNMGGKKTDILNLQQLFKKIYYGINMDNEGSKIAYLMDLIKDI